MGFYTRILMLVLVDVRFEQLVVEVNLLLSSLGSGVLPRHEEVVRIDESVVQTVLDGIAEEVVEHRVQPSGRQRIGGVNHTVHPEEHDEATAVEGGAAEEEPADRDPEQETVAVLENNIQQVEPPNVIEGHVLGEDVMSLVDPVVLRLVHPSVQGPQGRDVLDQPNHVSLKNEHFDIDESGNEIPSEQRLPVEEFSELEERPEREGQHPACLEVIPDK